MCLLGSTRHRFLVTLVALTSFGLAGCETAGPQTSAPVQDSSSTNPQTSVEGGSRAEPVEVDGGDLGNGALGDVSAPGPADATNCPDISQSPASIAVDGETVTVSGANFDEVPPAPGDVVLVVSNQSFADDPVRLTFSVGGVCLLSRTFFVEGQHTFVSFAIRGLPAGAHDATIYSHTGVQTSATFTTNADAPRYVAITYWHYRGEPGGRQLLLEESDAPFGIA